MRRLVMVSAVLLSLAGCSSNPTSPTLPPLSANVLPDVAASPGAPVPSSRTGVASPHKSLASVPKPLEASVHDDAGAEAFARYWFAELNAAQEALDPTRLIEISAPGCESCRNHIESLKRNAQEGNYYVGGGATISSVVSPPVDANAANVLVVVDDAELLVYSRGGTLIDTVPADTKNNLEVDALWVNSKWLVAKVLRLK